jgi:hypothetical protein
VATLWKAELTDDLIAHLSDEEKYAIRRELDEAVQAVCEVYEVGREYRHEL